MKKNINFIFGLLNKKKVLLCLSIEAFLDLLYYFIPFTFALFLTLPFTLKKAITVTTIFVISKVLRCFVLYLERLVMDDYLYKYSYEQSLEYYKSLTKIPVETLFNYQTGYLQSIIEKTSTLVKDILSAEYIGIILSFTFFFYTLFKQSVLLFFIALIMSAACVLVSVYILKKANKKVESLYDQEYEYSSVYQDFISNIKTVRALNNNTYFENRIKEEGMLCKKKNIDYIKCYSLEELVRNILIVIPFILALLKAIYDLANGVDTLGLITFYISLYLEMGFIFDELSVTIVNCFELKAIKQKCNQLFEKIDNRKILKKFNTISLNNVKINYKDVKFSINIKDFVINKNDKISITGKSGQGKTSLINLILGNINSYDGDVYFDKLSLLDYKLDIGIVSQEIELFNMSLKDNLCLDKNIDDEEIKSYLKELELDELLLLNDGIYTKLGEKGLKLSTGQKRRVNILRSYLMNKDIYILDEPTSNLDKHTEEVVVNFILKYFKNKTLIIATHNEKINEICNKFYYFENHNLYSKKLIVKN